MSGLVFGPVPSRRLGRSLGVDLVPFKTCSFDCLYCQLGRTSCKTVERKQWVPVERVLHAVRDKLDTRPDYITLSGSGEPTLFRPLDRLIAGIRSMSAIPVAVLTNGSLLHDAEVRRELAGADLVVPSLDAPNEAVFQAVNRPHESLGFEQVVEGLVDFRRGFSGAYWLEVFLLGGYTDSESQIAALRDCIARISPDRVQLNTVTRPPAEEAAVAVAHERLLEIAADFDPPAEVIAEFRGDDAFRASASGRGEVLDMLRRRPCSVDDIAAGLAIHRNEAVKLVEHLLSEAAIRQQRVGDKLYYLVAPAASD